MHDSCSATSDRLEPAMTLLFIDLIGAVGIVSPL